MTDTVRSYFNNYVYYKWQRSTDGGASWNDVTGAIWTGYPLLEWFSLGICKHPILFRQAKHS